MSAIKTTLITLLLAPFVMLQLPTQDLCAGKIISQEECFSRKDQNNNCCFSSKANPDQGDEEEEIGDISCFKSPKENINIYSKTSSLTYQVTCNSNHTFDQTAMSENDICAAKTSSCDEFSTSKVTCCTETSNQEGEYTTRCLPVLSDMKPSSTNKVLRSISLNRTLVCDKKFKDYQFFEDCTRTIPRNKTDCAQLSDDNRKCVYDTNGYCVAYVGGDLYEQGIIDQSNDLMRQAGGSYVKLGVVMLIGFVLVLF